MRPLTRLAFALLLLLAALPAGAAGAQQRYARLRGKVVDAESKIPVAGTRVIIAATGRYVVTDSLGAFDVVDSPTGIIRFIFSKEGYPRAQVVLAFAPGEVMTQDFELDMAPPAEDSLATRRNVQVLPAEEVVATPSRGVRYADFERRMKTGRGHYITRETIEKAGYATMQDAARVLRGVSVECVGARSCNIRMARAPRGCYPVYYVDGREDDFFGPQVAIRDIEGMEVYVGASDVPGEFAGATASCGVVVIWTRNGPPKAQPAPPAARRP
jgi:hypothetical protein